MSPTVLAFASLFLHHEAHCFCSLEPRSQDLGIFTRPVPQPGTFSSPSIPRLAHSAFMTLLAHLLESPSLTSHHPGLSAFLTLLFICSYTCTCSLLDVHVCLWGQWWDLLGLPGHLHASMLLNDTDNCDTMCKWKQSCGVRDEYRVAKTSLRRNRDSKFKQYYIILVFLFLIYFTLTVKEWQSLGPFMYLQVMQFHSF